MFISCIQLTVNPLVIDLEEKIHLCAHMHIPTYKQRNLALGLGSECSLFPGLCLLAFGLYTTFFCAEILVYFVKCIKFSRHFGFWVALIKAFLILRMFYEPLIFPPALLWVLFVVGFLSFETCCLSLVPSQLSPAHLMAALLPAPHTWSPHP